MNIKKYGYVFIVLAVTTILSTTLPAFADNQATAPVNNGVGRGGRMFNLSLNGMRPIVFGTVSALSGNTITMSGKQGFNKNAIIATYTVDATNAKIMKNRTASTVASIVVGDTLMIQGALNGTNVVATVINDGVVNGNRNMARPAVFGTVNSVSGNTITVTSKQFGPNTANTSTTIYTVDATNAKITKNNATGTISSIVVGDTISVQGTVNGTSVVATTIRDGVMNGNVGGDGQAVSSIVGNGQPVVLGTVSTISGLTLTITNKSNVSYTVDATNAKIAKDQNTAGSISDIVVGDTVVVQGTVNGNSIVASNIIDQNKLANTQGVNNQQHKGLFGGIGSFFKKLFGF